MVVVFDTRKNDKITSIKWNSEDITLLNWSVTDDSTCAFDFANKRIIVGQSGIEVLFNDTNAMQAFVDQYYIYIPGAFDPSIDGIKPDPKNDRMPDPTGTIVSHTYTNTDIEKTLIQGS